MIAKIIKVAILLLFFNWVKNITGLSIESLPKEALIGIIIIGIIALPAYLLIDFRIKE